MLRGLISEISLLIVETPFFDEIKRLGGDDRVENVYMTGEQVETGIHLEIPFFPQTCGIIVYVFCHFVTTVFSDVILGITLLKSQIFGFIQNCNLNLEVCIKAMRHQTDVDSTDRVRLLPMVWNTL